jgi:hypothetical protein
VTPSTQGTADPDPIAKHPTNEQAMPFDAAATSGASTLRKVTDWWHEHSVRVIGLIVYTIFIVALLAIVALLRLFGFQTTQGATDIATYFTIIGTVGTAAILLWSQSADQRSSKILHKLDTVVSRVENNVKKMLEDRTLDPEVARLAQVVSKNLEVLPEYQNAYTPDSEDRPVTARMDNGIELYDSSDIPLRVIAAIVDVWIKDRRRGRWNLSKIKLGFRKAKSTPRGGNRPWFVEFQDGSLWKVYWGGRSKSGEERVNVEQIK